MGGGMLEQTGQLGWAGACEMAAEWRGEVCMRPHWLALRLSLTQARKGPSPLLCWLRLEHQML